MSTQRTASDAFESNAGDDFHVLWAARKALQLILPGTNLKAIGIEGPSPKEAIEVDPKGGNLLSIDTAEYYGSTQFLECDVVVFSQLKYSTRRSTETWTAARLCQGKKKGSKGSIIERLADTLMAYLKKYEVDNVEKRLILKLISNRPVSKKLSRSLKQAQGELDVRKPVLWGVLKKSLSDETAKELDRLYRASKLKSRVFTVFLSMLDFDECDSGSRFEHEAALIEELTEFDDPRIRDQYLRLRRLIEIRMLPEGKNLGLILAEDLAPVFEIGSFEKAFPANSRFGKVENPIERKQLKKIAASIAQNQGKVTCIHAGGGSGKTTLCQMLPPHFPEFSETVVFDCYGNGSYTNPAKVRHIHRRAIVQIANEVAVRTGSNLLLSFDLPKEDYLESLVRRLSIAERLIRKENSEALLVVIIDAADNSYAAAQKLGGENFVDDVTNRDFVEGLPEGCRVVVTTRSHRKPDLRLPSNAESIELKNFDEEESAAFLKTFFPDASSTQVSDFHSYSAGIPRRQAYALNQKQEGVEAVLGALTPKGTTIEGVIDKQLEDARKKLGIDTEIDGVCKSLVCLPTPIPIQHVVALSSVNEKAVRDFCEDMFPGLNVERDAISFADEDFETHLETLYKEALPDYQLKATEYLLKAAKRCIYAAENVAYFLFQSEQYEELFSITMDKNSLELIADPILKKNVFFNRAKLALKSAIKNDSKETLLKLLLIAAKAAKTDKAVRKLITEHADLTAKYGDYQTVQRLYLEEQEVHWYGPSHLNCAATLSRDEETQSVAREHLRNARAWLKWRHQKNEEELEDYPIGDDDIAAETEAMFNLFGFDRAYSSLDRWRPKTAVFRVSKLVFERLIGNWKARELCEAVKKTPLRPDIELILMNSLFENGLDVPREFVESNHKVWLKFSKYSKSVEASLQSAGVLFCELLAIHGYEPRNIVPLIELFSPTVPNYVALYNEEARIDTLLRARALKALLLGKELKAEELMPSDLIDEKELEDKEKQEREKKKEEFRRIYDPLIPVYRCRLEALTGTYKGKPDEVIETAMKGSTIGYQVGVTEEVVLKNLCSHAIVDAALSISRDPQQWIDKVQSKYLGKDVGLPTKLQIAKKLSRYEEMHEKALRILDEVSQITEANPTVASDQADTYVQCSTIADRVNAEVAEDYYKKAIEVAEEIDQEAFAEIVCLHSLSERASADCSDLYEPELAYYLASYTETCSLRMYGYDHFPWPEGIQAITNLDSASGLAALSRWQDRGTNYIGDGILSVLSAAVRKQYVSPSFACAALILAGYKDGRVSKARLDILSAELKEKRSLKGILSVIAKDILLHDEIDDRKHRAGIVIDWLRENSPKDLAGVQELVSMYEFVDSLCEEDAQKPDGPTYQKARKSRSKTKVDWRTVLGKKDFCESKNIEKAVSFLDGKQEFGYELIHDFFERIRRRCTQDQYTTQLDALLNVDPDVVPFYPLLEALRKRLEEWDYHASVRKWKKANLEKFAKIHFHEFLSYERFSFYTLDGIADAFDVPNDDRRIEIVTPSLSDYVDSIPAEAFYDITQAYLKLAPKGAALNILRWYLPELDRDIRFDLADGKWTDELVPPRLSGAAIASFLWACLANPDKRIRWRAVHVVRRAVALGENEVLDHLMRASETPNTEPFRDTQHIFYEYSARLWLFMLIDRLSTEHPKVLVRHADAIYEEATCEGTYHALVRHFAKSAALSLSKYRANIYSNDQVDILEKVSRSPFEPIDKAKDYGRGGADDDNGRFSFGYDTTDYWYSSLVRIFDTSQKEVIEKAEAVICDKWGFEGEVWEQDPLHRRNGGSYSYELTNNRHGEEPTVESLQLYLEYHAMFFVADEFLNTKRIARDEWEAAPWNEWMRRWNLVREGFWLSDLRDTTPLEIELWTMPRVREKDWPYQISGSYLDRHASLDQLTAGAYVLVNGHIYRYLDKNTESVNISSALVEPDKAPSLLRALQSCKDSSNYKIPDEGEDLEIDKSGFRLKGWIKCVSAEWGGIDEIDPLQSRLSKSIHYLGQEFADWADVDVSRDGRVTFLRDDSSVVVAEYQNWNDFKHTRYEHGLKTEGNRLFVSTQYLQEFLSEKDQCLILECQIRRSGENDDRGYYPGYAKLYLLYPDGRIETL